MWPHYTTELDEYVYEIIGFCLQQYDCFWGRIRLVLRVMENHSIFMLNQIRPSPEIQRHQLLPEQLTERLKWLTTVSFQPLGRKFWFGTPCCTCREGVQNRVCSASRGGMGAINKSDCRAILGRNLKKVLRQVTWHEALFALPCVCDAAIQVGPATLALPIDCSLCWWLWYLKAVLLQDRDQY